MSSAGLKEVEILWEEVRELSLGSYGQVERLDSPPSPIRFLRDFVSPNKPCIISNAFPHWPATSLWSSDDYLCNTLSSTDISVHLTPNGRADSLVPHPNDPSRLCFASAHVERMPFREALLLISNPERKPNIVAYAQQQNDCFNLEYGALASDCESHIDWATDALGCLPEAVNLWIGTKHSETSFHKDHYENLYAVVSGEKHFVLLPPTDVHRMYIRPYPAAQYSYSKETEEFSLELEDPVRHVPWCSVNPYPSHRTEETAMNDYPLYFSGPKPFECTVKAGEMLYLPSMWFHHVRQSGESNERTIAVNYWYDMRFDIKYAYFNFLQSIYDPSLEVQACPEVSCADSSRGSGPLSSFNFEGISCPDGVKKGKAKRKGRGIAIDDLSKMSEQIKAYNDQRDSEITLKQEKFEFERRKEMRRQRRLELQEINLQLQEEIMKDEKQKQKFDMLQVLLSKASLTPSEDKLKEKLLMDLDDYI